MARSARRVAFEPKVHLAILGGLLFKPRGDLSSPPETLNEKAQIDRALQRRFLNSFNSALSGGGGGGGGGSGRGDSEYDFYF